jgi:hypothetical protein
MNFQNRRNTQYLDVSDSEDNQIVSTHVEINPYTDQSLHINPDPNYYFVVDLQTELLKPEEPIQKLRNALSKLKQIFEHNLEYFYDRLINSIDETTLMTEFR